MFVFQLAKEYRRGRRKGRGKRGRPGAVGPPGNPGPQVSNCVEINESMDMLLCSNAVAFFFTPQGLPGRDGQQGVPGMPGEVRK